ncbi:MAG: hypothetical protein JSV49_02200, partial [Thermoplasmata archaeon]
MAAKICRKIFSFIVVSLFLISSCLSFIPSAAQSQSCGINNDPALISNPQSCRAARQDWELSQTIEKTVQVQNGNDHYFYLDAETGALREKEMPAPEAGLNERTLRALEKVPDWLHDDLAEKFRQTANEILITSFGSSAPCFSDMDSDGDLDLTTGRGELGLEFYRNEGTKNMPIFVRDDEFYAEANTLMLTAEVLDEFTEIAPTSADIDADFDSDLLIGTNAGGLYILENSGSPYEPLFANLEQITDIRTNNFAAPMLVDYDEDNDFDLVIGDSNGKIGYFHNVGSDVAPDWNRVVPNPFAEIQVQSQAVPFLYDLDNDGDLDVTIGDSTDNLYYFRCASSGLSRKYVLDETMYVGLYMSTYNHPVLVDIDADSLPELIIGNSAGSSFHYENYGYIGNPEWNIWSSYKAVPGVSYYQPYEFLRYQHYFYTDGLADVINDTYNTNPLWVDEVAFAIANTAPEVLRRIYADQPQMFLDNAKLIYEIDQYLEYATVKEYNQGTGDYYSTVEYNTIENGIAKTRTIPKDIYYWYIVHPKITEEMPGFVDPESGFIMSPIDGGRFWREYLFYHADESYPPDNSGASGDGIDDYPTDSKPPLLKDLLSGVKYLWNGTSWTAPGGRDVKYGSSALIRISNWVGKTLILNQQEVSDDERPTQPVRIAHHHNGNCGELQDLTAAAARTALIPTVGVNLVAEDHVWNEFYENGWHQWDNHWSDSGSHIDKFGMYWYGWGERGGSGIWMHQGDDDTIDHTYKYIPKEIQSKVIVTVRDRFGFPVDGARVLFGSHWMAERNIEQVDVTFPFPGIWNYTDTQGESEFHLAMQNFTIKIISKLGNAVQEKTYIGAGGLYYFNFTLEGALPRPYLPIDEVQHTSPGDPTYKLYVEYTVIDGVQYPPNPESGSVHPEMQERSNIIDSFMGSEIEFEIYQSGWWFSPVEVEEDVTSYSNPEILLDSSYDWY